MNGTHGVSNRYRSRALYGDYSRAGFGTVICGVPVLFSPDSLVFSLVLGGLSFLFLAHGLRTFGRQLTIVDVTDTEISAIAPRILSGHISHRVRIPWNRMSSVKLSYFSTRRDDANGWMQLRLRGDGKTLRFDSNLDGFEAIVARAASIVAENGIALSAATRSNLRALGVTVETRDRLPQPADGEDFQRLGANP